MLRPDDFRLSDDDLDRWLADDGWERDEDDGEDYFGDEPLTGEPW